MNHVLNAVLALPEMIVLGLLCVCLMLDLFFANRFKHIAYYTAQVTLIAAFVATYCAIPQTAQYAFSQVFVLDSLGAYFKLFVYVAVFLCFFYGKRAVDENKYPAGEYYVLSLLSVLGMMVLISSATLMMFFLGIELMSLPIYILVAIDKSKLRIEAAMKYFVLGAIATGILLFGCSYLFGVTGALSFEAMQHVTSQAVAHPTMMTLSVVFVLAALAFKLGLAPFHTWVPDVYEGAPTPVTMFISGAPKLAVFVILFRLFVDALPAMQPQAKMVLIFLAIASLVVGNIAALLQKNIKRLFAYSAIAHLGYLLLGFLTFQENGLAASMFYVVVYTLMSVAGFGVVILLSSKGKELAAIEQYSGLYYRNPWLAFLMLIILFSMAGIPPLAGFMAKVGVFEVLVKDHTVWLAVLAVVTAIIAVYYYLRVVKVMFFETPEDKSRIPVPAGECLVMSLNVIAIVVIGLFPGALFDLCHRLI